MDPDDEPDGIASLQSEIGRTERYWLKRSLDPDAMDAWSRLRAFRQRADVEVVDMNDDETLVYAELTTRQGVAKYGLEVELGPGEAAVIALAEARVYPVILDEAHGRRVLNARSPGTPVETTRDVLRRAVAQGELDSGSAQIIYDDMLSKGYRGPQDLFS